MHYNKTITLKNSTLCTIRNADERDGEKVLEVFLLTHSQTDFLLSYPDENTFSAEDESRYLKAKTESCDEIEILAEINGNQLEQEPLISEDGRLPDKILVRASIVCSRALPVATLPSSSRIPSRS